MRDRTLRFVHFCGGQPIRLIGFAGAARAALLFSPAQIFTQLQRRALTSGFCCDIALLSWCNSGSIRLFKRRVASDCVIVFVHDVF